MQNSGNCGRSSRHYEVDDLNPSVLRGRLASETEPKVYPDDYCIKCVTEGNDSEKCFHKHWGGKKEPK